MLGVAFMRWWVIYSIWKKFITYFLLQTTYCFLSCYLNINIYANKAVNSINSVIEILGWGLTWEMKWTCARRSISDLRNNYYVPGPKVSPNRSTGERNMQSSNIKRERPNKAVVLCRGTPFNRRVTIFLLLLYSFLYYSALTF